MGDGIFSRNSRQNGKFLGKEKAFLGGRKRVVNWDGMLLEKRNNGGGTVYFEELYVVIIGRVSEC